MRPTAIFSVVALLVSGGGIAAAANSTRIAETGAILLGNALRCGVADERVVRAGKVIRDLIAAASDGASEQIAAKARFAELFRVSAGQDGDTRAANSRCQTVLTQFERLEHFRGQTSAR
jgi:hypothetical protein